MSHFGTTLLRDGLLGDETQTPGNIGAIDWQRGARQSSRAQRQHVHAAAAIPNRSRSRCSFSQ